MALTFTPKFHTEVQTGSWARAVSPLVPFGWRPTMEQEQKALQEAKQIQAEGDLIVILDLKC